MNAQNTRSLWESEPATSVNAQNTRSLWESEPATSVNAQNTRSLRERVTERKSTKQTCCWITDSLSHTTYVETNNLSHAHGTRLHLRASEPSVKFLTYWSTSLLAIVISTRIHSSKMRTARSSTVRRGRGTIQGGVRCFPGGRRCYDRKGSDTITPPSPPCGQNDRCLWKYYLAPYIVCGRLLSSISILRIGEKRCLFT